MNIENQLKTKKARLLELGSNISSLNTSEKSEFKGLCNEVELLQEAVNVSQKSALPVGESKSLTPASTFTNSSEYKSAITKWTKGISTQIEGVTVDMKTLLTNAGMATTSVRSNFIGFSAQETPRVVDLFATITINQPSYLFLKETTFTNGTEPIAEGAAKPESAFAFTESTVTARKLASHIPVTSEALADVSNAESIINDRLLTMFRLKVEHQIINGSGVAPEMNGLLNLSGIQTHTLGADTIIDAVKKMATKVETIAFATPNAIVMHPDLWTTIVLNKDAEDKYYFQGPISAETKTMWGIPVITTTFIPSDKVIVIDTTHFALVLRQDATFSTGVINDDFTKNIQRILVEGRMNLAAHRPAALCLMDVLP